MNYALNRVMEKLNLIIFLIGFGIRITNGLGYSAEIFMIIGMIGFLSFGNSSKDTNK